MAGDYMKFRRHHRDISGSLAVAAAGTTSTLVTCRGAQYTVFIQKYHIQLTTGSAGKTWTLKDSAGTPVPISGDLDCTTAPASYERDFGPQGVALTEAKNLTLTISAAGAAGIVTWEGYMKLTSTINLSTANTAN